MSTQSATPPRSMIGERVGAYQIVKELARGGMGVVYEATHGTIGHRAAVKVLSSALSRDPAHTEYVGRFIDEARAVNVIQHPGIVKIFDIGVLPDGTVYIMMEYLEGPSLWRRIAGLPGRRVGPGAALRITRQIASSLAAAHDKRIIHRDLKPDNVILIRDPEAPAEERTKVLDFGVARFLDSPQRRTAAGMVMGTVTYMSPEQCEGSEALDGKVDVYALGIMLYQMLAGQPPFEGEMGPVMVSHIRQPPHPLRDLFPSAPAAVYQLVDEMLAKRPEARPAMEQVVERIRQIEAQGKGLSDLSARAPAPAGGTGDAATVAVAVAQAPTVVAPSVPVIAPARTDRPGVSDGQVLVSRRALHGGIAAAVLVVGLAISYGLLAPRAGGPERACPKADSR